MAGYGSSVGGNKIFFTLKVKRGTEVDPHIEVRKNVKGKYEQVDECKFVEGNFAGIDHQTYEVEKNNKKVTKDKILVYLQGNDEVFVIQTAMNSHARNIMNSLLTLFAEIQIENLKFYVYEKDGFANISIKHNGEFVEWKFDYETQKNYIVAPAEGTDGYNNYSKLEAMLLEKWKSAKTYIEAKFPIYRERYNSVIGADQSSQTDTTPIATQPQGLADATTNAPAPIEEDDLPF